MEIFVVLLIVIGLAAGIVVGRLIRRRRVKYSGTDAMVAPTERTYNSGDVYRPKRAHRNGMSHTQDGLDVADVLMWAMAMNMVSSSEVPQPTTGESASFEMPEDSSHGDWEQAAPMESESTRYSSYNSGFDSGSSYDSGGGYDSGGDSGGGGD